MSWAGKKSLKDSFRSLFTKKEQAPSFSVPAGAPLLPDTVSTDAREAMAEIAKSQAGGDIALYKAFANADSLEKGDAAFVMFVLDYANVLGAGDAIKDDSKAIVKSGDLDIPVDADTEAWVKALTDADLYTEAGKADMPQLGDIAFVNGMAAVVTEIAEDGSYTFFGQKDAEAATVEEYNAEAEAVEGFVSLEAIAPDMFVEAEEEQPAEEPVVKEEAAEADENAEDKLTGEVRIKSVPKNKKPRPVPYTDAIRELLDRVRKVEEEQKWLDEYIFTGWNGRITVPQLSSCLKNKCNQAGIRAKGINAYRRTVNSLTRANGLSAEAASAILGNTPAVNSLYYTFDVTEDRKKHDVLDKVNQFMLNPTSTPTSEPNQPNH